MEPLTLYDGTEVVTNNGHVRKEMEVVVIATGELGDIYDVKDGKVFVRFGGGFSDDYTIKSFLPSELRAFSSRFINYPVLVTFGGLVCLALITGLIIGYRKK